MTPGVERGRKVPPRPVTPLHNIYTLSKQKVYGDRLWGEVSLNGAYGITE
jgi:hypothetical protein